MGRHYLPWSDGGLLAFAARLDARVRTRPDHCGVPPELAAGLEARTQAYTAAMAAVADPAYRTAVGVAAKNSARHLLRPILRQVCQVIQNNPATTDALRVELRLPIYKAPSRIGPPTLAPWVDIMAVSGRTCHLILRDGQGRIRRPPGVAGACILAGVGREAPADSSQWRVIHIATRTRASVTLDLPPGTPLWLAARWFNPRMEHGPCSAPRLTHIQFGPVRDAAQAMAA